MAVSTILGRRRNLCCSPKRYFQPETSSPTVFGFQIEFDVVLQKNYVSAVIRSMSGWVIRVTSTRRRSLPIFTGGLNRSTQHFILKERWSVV